MDLFVAHRTRRERDRTDRRVVAALPDGELFALEVACEIAVESKSWHGRKRKAKGRLHELASMNPFEESMKAIGIIRSTRRASCGRAPTTRRSRAPTVRVDRRSGAR